MNGTQEASTARRPSFLSRLFVVALIAFATTFVIRALAPQTLGETARRQLLSQLEDHYRDYTVSIRKGHFDPDIGLIFEDLRISDRSSLGLPSREMVRIERLTVVADIDPKKLLNQQNPLLTRRIVIDGVQANAWLQLDGKISLVDLLPLPSFGPVAPRMDMHRVKVRMLDSASNNRPVDVELDEVVLINTENAGGGIDKAVTIQGSTDFANDLLVRIDTKDGSTDIRCALNGAHLSRDLFDRLPTAWTRKVQHAKELQCVCDAKLALHRSAEGKLNYQLKTTVHDGSFSHPSLPRPISELRGVVVCDPKGVSVSASQGTLGDAVIRVTGRTDGYQWPCNVDFDLSARGLLLDDHLAAALPESMQVSWDRLQPLGRIDVDAKLSHADSTWKTDATVICKGVDVRYEKFPYPVENLVGRIEISDSIATTEALDGRIGGNRMQCAFRLPIRPGITNEKSFVIATDGPVPIDNTLLNSLSPRGVTTTALESFVRSLGPPRGSLQLATAMLTTDASGRQTRKIDLRVIDGHLRYEKFAYPLYNVAGTIQVENELIKLVGFRATNANAGTVLCDGSYQMPVKTPTPNAYRISDAPLAESRDSELQLNFRAANVPMDNALRSSLPPSSQQTWDAISPGGVLDELDVVLGQHGSGNPLTLDVTAKQLGHDQVTSRSLSLRPTSLPYRLDVTRGVVRYDGSQVTIESIEGKHDASTLAADGRCVQDENGRWELALNLHSGSRMHPDAELIAALPIQMQEAMRRLQLRGPVNIRGKTRLAMPDATHPEPAIQWDLVLQLEGNRIAEIGPVHSLRGELSVKGIRDEIGIRAVGDVRIDSMHVYDLQIVGIRGPFSIDGDRLHLGGVAVDRNNALGASDRAAQQAPSIRGKLFGGTLDLDGGVELSSGNFDVGLAVKNAQVPILLADFGHSDNEMTGTFSGQTQLRGNLGTMDLLSGNGDAQVTGANLYQLPLIVQVLNLLRIKASKDVAFTDAEIDFSILGETMTFNDLQIWGDLVGLHGGGTLDGRRELDLTFNTAVSPQNSFTQILRPLRNQRYTLWTIDVRGPLHSLDIERSALDGVGETLERLFPGMTDDDADSSAESEGRFGGWFR